MSPSKISTTPLLASHVPASCLNIMHDSLQTEVLMLTVIAAVCAAVCFEIQNLPYQAISQFLRVFAVQNCEEKQINRQTNSNYLQLL